MKDRENFLVNHWEAYPVLPAEAHIFGRIVQLDLKKQGFSLLEDFRSRETFYYATQTKFPISILREGDIIAATIISSIFSEQVELGNIWLLTPCILSEKECQKNPSLEWLPHWSYFLRVVRDFFNEKGFLEVQTPTLVVCPGTEPFLDVFSTELISSTKRSKKLYLPTSPELHLKKLLSMGIHKVFEIKSCFRNGEITKTHQPEFYMLEWYRAFSNLEEIKNDVQDLISFLSQKIIPSHTSGKGFGSLTMKDLFKTILNFDLTPTTTREDLLELAKKEELISSDIMDCNESWDDLFFLIFISKIEVQILGSSHSQPLFLEKYPPSQAALARVNSEGWADRFEVYWKGLEIANAFHELNDPHLQRVRLLEDLDKKRALKKEMIPLDEDFLDHLKKGMPPSGGIALGLERLFMALHNIDDISVIKPFPYQ